MRMERDIQLAKRRFRHASKRGQHGIALIFVLWIVGIAALLVSTLNATVRSGAAFMGNEISLLKAQTFVDAGLEIAAARLIDADEKRRWRADGRVYRVTFMNHNLKVRIDDPNGLINVNYASAKILVRFFRAFVESDREAEKACRIVLVARGARNTKSCGDMNFERGTKTAQKVSRSTSSASGPAFIDINQVRRLPGFDPALFKKVAPHLTVYSRSALINPFVASDEILAAIPKITPVDISIFRSLQQREVLDAPEMMSALERARRYLTDKTGPVYVVTVTTSDERNENWYGREFVIVIGLDEAAPYRLVATRIVGSDQTDRGWMRHISK